MVRTWWHKLFSQGQSGAQRGYGRARVRQRRRQKPLLESLEERCLLSYSVTDLGTLPGDNGAVPLAINGSGQVAGTSQFVDAYDNVFLEAFRWDAANGMQDLGRLPGGSYSNASGINNNGQVVGDSGGRFIRAFLWDTARGMQDLGSLPGHTGSLAYSINDNGQVVGLSGNESRPSHAFLWDAVNGMQDLGTLPGDAGSHAHGINNNSQVVGESFSSLSGSGHAFLWDAVNGMQDLGTLPGDHFSGAVGINNTGQVIGFSYTPGILGHAFLWDAVNGMQDLGRPPGFNGFSARGINDSGQVVGESCNDPGPGSPPVCHAFLWQNGALSDLNDLIPPRSRSIATAINNAGQIVAFGGTDLYYSPRAFLLTPDSAPGGPGRAGAAVPAAPLLVDASANPRLSLAGPTTVSNVAMLDTPLMQDQLNPRSVDPVFGAGKPDLALSFARDRSLARQGPEDHLGRTDAIDRLFTEWFVVPALAG